MSAYVDFSRLRPSNFGEWILHLLMLAVAVTGMATSLVAIGWFLLMGLQLLISGV